MWKISATSEDTESAGDEVGFLQEPHKVLYPAAFRGKDKIPTEVKAALKNHVLNAIEEEYHDPDQFIYFTIYGSGISFNWDEGGDFDLQLWVNIDKFIELHSNEDANVDSDQLISDIRRLIAPINFPTFADLGLRTKDSEGKMMIQYYAKPGTGSKEENLASKPYACYDLETDEWYYHPKPLKPTFYGEAFLLLTPKAEDMASQADSLVAEYERDILNWKFWRSMYTRYHNHKYREQMFKAQENADQRQLGIKNMFDSIFKGRSDAYSPGGKGIKDERDILQKLLEVWGTFQKLKHYARAKLPWEEQELPAPPKDLGEFKKGPKISKVVELPIEYSNEQPMDGVPFIYIRDEDTLYLANNNGDHTSLFNAIFKKNNWADEQELMDLWERSDFGTLYPDGDWATYQDNGNDRRIKKIINSEILYPKSSSWTRVSKWNDVVQKAKRYYDDHRVQLQNNTPEHSIATVNGDTGTYETEIWRQDPNNPNVISLWGCSCPWGEHSWGRTRGYKKYEGRPCAHAVVVNWECQRQPYNEDAQGNQQGQLFNPNQTLPQQAQPTLPGQQPDQTFEQFIAPTAPGGVNMPTQIPATSPAENPIAIEPPAFSLLKGPKEVTQLELPGTFSKKAQADMDGVMIGLFLPKDIASMIKKEDGEPIENMHITLIYFKDKVDDRKDWSKIEDLVKEFSVRFGSFSGEIDGYGTFETEDGKVLWANPDIPSLERLRNQLLEACEETGFPVNTEHEFNPHITVKYNWEGEVPKLEEPLPVTFTNLTFAQGKKKKNYSLDKESTWSFISSFSNGDFVRNSQPVFGADDRGDTYTVPRNTVGEVLWSDDQQSVVIFSINSGPLGAHLIRVTDDTSKFMNAPKNIKDRGPAPRRR